MTAAPSRRSFLRGAAGTGLLALVGCTDESPDPASPTRPKSPTVTTPPPAATSTLLVYFSRPGENYWYGDRRDLEIGNTEVLATMITDRIDCDTYCIKVADPYPDDYEETVARHVREQDQDARPAIASPLPDLTAYDTVILASPIWNVRPPMIMSTFVESAGLGTRRLLPVTTHAMSGLGRAVEVYTDLAPDAAIGDGLAVRGEEVAEAGPDLDQWLREAALIN